VLNADRRLSGQTGCTPLYYTAPLIGAIAAILGGISFGAAIGAAFFVWGAPAWGFAIVAFGGPPCRWSGRHSASVRCV